ncbi:MAG: hypothetical protein NT062_00730 [Proteobacteria bacterium]|nr:hypothetical protein [Pseudomonadota bacterium]
MTLAASDERPWRFLHDGTIVRLERDLADEVSVWVDCAFVRARLAEDGALFRLRLAGCTRFEYTPYDEPPLTELAAIASSEPAIAVATFADDTMTVWGGAGVLRMTYASLRLELDTGRPLPIDVLARAVRDYWDAWRAANEIP